MADTLALIRGAKLPEKTVPLCLRGDLAAQHEYLCTQLGMAQREAAATESLAGSPEVTELAQQIVDLEKEMESSVGLFVLRALPRTEWAALVAKHPPRRHDGVILTEDAQGVNSETFPDEAVRACMVDPVLSDADWHLLVSGAITDAQYGQLVDATWALNRGSVSVPFSRAASRIARGSGPA